MYNVYDNKIISFTVIYNVILMVLTMIVFILWLNTCIEIVGMLQLSRVMNTNMETKRTVSVGMRDYQIIMTDSVGQFQHCFKHIVKRSLLNTI